MHDAPSFSSRASAGSPDAVLFAKLIAARETRGELALLGLSHEQLDSLFNRHLKGQRPPAVSHGLADIPLHHQTHADFVSALRALLLHNVSSAVDVNDAWCLASIIACACLRPDHLWRDLGLSGRDEVTGMLERYFPALVARNVENLRWKKFLARELALSLGVQPGPAPGCPRGTRRRAGPCS